MTVLLDSSTLIAAALQGHVHHDAVDQWLAGLDTGFATCPITQGSLIRATMHAGYSMAAGVELLGHIAADERHEFWADDEPYARVPVRGIVGHRQVTDAYLAHLSRTRGRRVATLDRGFAALHADVAELVATEGQP